jgi:hypothetical protein
VDDGFGQSRIPRRLARGFHQIFRCKLNNILKNRDFRRKTQVRGWLFTPGSSRPIPLSYRHSPGIQKAFIGSDEFR